MSVEANKALARQFIEQIWNKGDLLLARELLDDGLISHEPDVTTTGKDGFLTFIAEFRAAFPDLHFTIDDMVAEGDRVATRVTVRGTQQSDFRGVKATGRPVTWTGIGIIRVANGRIAEQWADTDAVGAAVQSGLRPAQPV